jgi:hypothetical protein
LSDDNRPEWETLGEEEGRVYHNVSKEYDSEVQAYRHLKDFQGRLIPKFISTVTYKFSSDSALPAIYIQARGVLLQYIRGFNLFDLTSALPDEPISWQDIIQSAVNAVKEINCAGVINLDAQPANIVVTKLDDRLYMPYLIDFAQCAFRWEYKDTEDENDEESFVFNAKQIDNPSAIGLVMVALVRKNSGHRLQISH